MSLLNILYLPLGLIMLLAARAWWRRSPSAYSQLYDRFPSRLRALLGTPRISIKGPQLGGFLALLFGGCTLVFLGGAEIVKLVS